MDNMRQKYEAALLEIESLKREVAALKLQIKLMSKAAEPAKAEVLEQSRAQVREERQIYNEVQTQEPAASVHQYSKVEDKLALFRSYFRGREDVYPVRWNSKRKGNVKEVIAEYGHIIVDECHHLSAFSFEQVLMKATARYVLGLTATLKRQDGQEPIVTMQLGPVRMKIDAKMLSGSRGFSLTVIPRYTPFAMPPEHASNPGIQEIYQHLVRDEERNTMIFDHIRIYKFLSEAKKYKFLLAIKTTSERGRSSSKGFDRGFLMIC